MEAGTQEKRILVVDDDKDDFWIISDYIAAIPNSEFRVEWTYTYEDALNRIRKEEFDLYIIDYRLGAKTGIDFLIEANVKETLQPVILLTGKGNYDIDVRSMALGAADYLVKTELNTEKVERSIRYAIGRAATLREIRFKEARFRTLFENSKDIIFILNRHFRILEINSAVEQVLGYSRMELLDKRFIDLLSPADSAADGPLRLNPGNGYSDLEIELYAKNGEKRSFILTLNREDAGAHKGNYQGILHDISNLKLLENGRIQNEKLAATGRLLRTIAHEVRNPINNITLAATHLGLEDEAEDRDEYLRIIRRNTKRINDLITELLYTSQPSSGNFDVTRLQDIVIDVVASGTDRLNLLGIKMELDIPKKNCTIRASRHSLTLAIQNILMNAIEAIDRQDGLIDVRLTEDQNHYHLVIADNGCGIDPENLDRLYEPFFTQKKNGLGLGLAYSLNIFRAHKVISSVESKKGIGTTFRLSFPIDRDVQ
jgi:PAS domain S-box-containing protein